MRTLIVLACFCAVYVAALPEKRLGVPLSAEDDCNPLIGGRNYSADPNDCSVFYICDHGWPKITFCPRSTIWTPRLERCMMPHLAENTFCNFVPPPPPEDLLAEQLALDEGTEMCEFDCLDGSKCIAFRAVCDGVPHCRDGSDEIECAPPCNPTTCQLPNCRCAGTDIPGGFRNADTPQLVLIAVDEAIRVEDYNHLYQQIFKKVDANRRRIPRTNPDGCPMVGTFFASLQFTDFAAAQSLYREGHEIATHSVSKTLPASYWRDVPRQVWHEEFVSNRFWLSELGNIPAGAIVGKRDPYLQSKGDESIFMAERNGFLYDSSYATARIEPMPPYPYTLDHRSGLDCPVQPCPVKPHTMWEIPLVDWIDTNDTLCENVDSCYFPESKEEAMQLFFTNFARHFQQNRAPFTVNIRPRFFYDNGYHNLEALVDFLDQLERMDDVYVVTYSDAIKWMRDPTPSSDMRNFFDCNYSNRTPLCDKPNLCGYYNITYAPNSVEHQGDRFFMTCNACPPSYPWVIPIEELRARGL